jgi:hypothetical protein
MHLFCCTKYCVDGACLNTECAADTGLFIDTYHRRQRFRFTVLGIQRLDLHTEQVRQRDDRRFTAGRALVDVGFAFGHGFGIGAAAGVRALAALCLWQQGIDLVYYRITFYLESDSRIGEQQSEYAGDDGEGDDDR